MPSYSTCRKPGCGDKIVWAITDGGKRMPINLHPDPEGNVAAYRDARGTWRARVLGNGDVAAPPERVYQSHFATCKPHIAEQAQARAIRQANRVTPGVVTPFRRGSVSHARR